MTVAPAAPLLTPCAPGWRALAVGGANQCEPWPEGGAQDCPFGEAHLPGRDGCEPIGASCPSGDFAEALPSDGPVVYVLASAAPGGDGTLATPYRTFSDFSLGGLSAGTIIALGKGRYEREGRFASRLRLQGACAAETVVTASAGATARSVIMVYGPEVEIRDIGIGPTTTQGVSVESSDGSLVLEGVAIEGATGVGLAVEAGRVWGRRLLVRGSVPSSFGGRGEGLGAWGAATVEIATGALEHNQRSGVYTDGSGATVTLEDVVVRDTVPNADTEAGLAGLAVFRGATANVHRSVLERNTTMGIYVDGASAEGPTIHLEDVVVRDSRSRPSDGRGGYGLSLMERTTATVIRSTFERNRGVGVYAGDLGTSLTLEDVVVRDTEARDSDGTGGRGLNVQAQATARILRVLVERNRALGVVATGRGTSVELRDVTVREVLEQACVVDRCPGLAFGIGVGSYYDASLDMRRFALTRAQLCGLQVALAGSLDAAEGEVSECDIGGCVQIAGYDLDRLRDRVYYVDNGTSLQSTDLPVPEAVGL